MDSIFNVFLARLNTSANPALIAITALLAFPATSIIIINAMPTAQQVSPIKTASIDPAMAALPIVHIAHL
jgi:hypothetical protein